MRLILGAGCAGLGLARALIDHGVDEPLVLLDRRTSFANDRTWCFWQTDPAIPRSGDAVHAWESWELVGRDGTRVRQTSTRHPYLQLPAERYYEASLRALKGAPQVELRLGERVRAAQHRPDGRIEVQSSGGSFTADQIHDAMGGAGPLGADRPAGAIELRQSFLGLEIEAHRAVFDPGLATLMDFRTDGRPGGLGGLHFMYVLPTSPTRALVEHTTLGPSTVPAAVRRRAITAYLSAHWALDRWDVVREERGVLPMTTHRFPLTRGPGIGTLGAAAGAVRPSSGYAFARIQRHVDAVARAVAQGTAAPARLARPHHALLDDLFLRALAVDPPSFDRILLGLAAHTDGDRFARFMSDASTVADDLAVMRALARPQFLASMATSSLLRPVGDRDRPSSLSR
jgi:lycopene beta-cyclase